MLTRLSTREERIVYRCRMPKTRLDSRKEGHRLLRKAVPFTAHRRHTWERVGEKTIGKRLGGGGGESVMVGVFNESERSLQTRRPTVASTI